MSHGRRDICFSGCWLGACCLVSWVLFLGGVCVVYVFVGTCYIKKIINIYIKISYWKRDREIAYFPYFYCTLYVFFGSSRCFYDSVLDNSNVHAMRNYVFMKVLWVYKQKKKIKMGRSSLKTFMKIVLRVSLILPFCTLNCHFRS